MRRARRLKVLLDGTPLLGERTGIGRYTAALSEELASTPELDVRVVAFTLRGWRTLRTVIPHGATGRGLPVPARLLRSAWRKSTFPPIELLAGTTDVVHGTNFVLPPALWAGGVLTIHDLAFLDNDEERAAVEPDLPEIVQLSANRAAAVCTPTAAVADVVHERLGVPRDKLVVTPLGVDAAWFVARSPGRQLRSVLKLPSEYLLFVGWDGPRKGLRTLLEAHAADPSLPPLVIAGPGRSKVEDRVVRTGYLSDVDLRSVVAGAKALVMPSRDEGFGLPVLEALACGVPVVTTDVPALVEVAGGHAIHVPVGDVEALAVAMAKAASNSPSADTLTAWAEHAGSYSWRACAQATIAAYKKANRH
ncbi:glycosyltransferase family 1 protein [Pseudonocardiaceae bacterium YIM PH 21723]|nr:glycosyltransferase family 1 protein [Pseudonocardiaceae bacterium YIM PH 21723]